MRRASGRWGGSMKSVKVPSKKLWKRCKFEEEPPINDEIQPIETFAKFESATNFKGFEALLSLALTTNCFTPMFKQKLDKHMMNWDDRLKRFSEMLTN